MASAKETYRSVIAKAGKAAGALSRHWPFRRGRDRLAILATLCGALPDPLVTVRSHLGDHLNIDSQSPAYRHAFFTGLYEPGITGLLAAIVTPGAVCVDIGANVGWHSLVMARHAGEAGKVHAFEPYPLSFQRLTDNIVANGLEDRIRASRLAVADGARTVAMKIDSTLPTTHVRLDLTASTGATTAETIALDDYCSGELIHRIDLIKLDVEGAERLVIRGAAATLSSPRAPILIVEAAEQTGQNFGFRPNDVLDDLARLNGFRFFVIDEAYGRLTEIDRFPLEHIGANVLCVPAGREQAARRLHACGLMR